MFNSFMSGVVLFVLALATMYYVVFNFEKYN